MKPCTFQGRALTSLLMTIGFVLVSLSGMILFFAPGGHGTPQGAWTWLFLTKRNWSDLHIVFGFLFLFVGIVHLWLNRKPLLNYLGKRQKLEAVGCETPRLRLEVVAAVFLCLGLFAGTLARTFPVNYLWDLRTAVRGSAQSGNGPLRP